VTGKSQSDPRKASGRRACGKGTISEWYIFLVLFFVLGVKADGIGTSFSTMVVCDCNQGSRHPYQSVMVSDVIIL
jgi:hypothetical protein